MVTLKMAEFLKRKNYMKLLLSFIILLTSNQIFALSVVVENIPSKNEQFCEQFENGEGDMTFISDLAGYTMTAINDVLDNNNIEKIMMLSCKKTKERSQSLLRRFLNEDHARYSIGLSSFTARDTICESDLVINIEIPVLATIWDQDGADDVRTNIQRLNSIFFERLGVELQLKYFTNSGFLMMASIDKCYLG